MRGRESAVCCCCGSSSPVYAPFHFRQGVWEEMKRRFTLFSTCSPPSSPCTPASLHVALNAWETTRELWVSRKILVWLFASSYAFPILFFFCFLFCVLSLSSWWLRVTCKSHLQVNSCSRCPFIHFWDVFRTEQVHSFTLIENEWLKTDMSVCVWGGGSMIVIDQHYEKSDISRLNWFECNYCEWRLIVKILLLKYLLETSWIMCNTRTVPLFI